MIAPTTAPNFSCGVADRQHQGVVQAVGLEHRSDERGEDIHDDRVDDGGEGGTDDDGDGKVDDIAPHDEILEAVEHGVCLLGGSKN